MHLVSIKLCLMRSQDRKQSVLMQELVSCRLTKEVGAASYIVLHELGLAGSLLIFDRIRPENVAEKSLSWWLTESLQVLQVVDGLQVWRDAAMQGQELVIH